MARLNEGQRALVKHLQVYLRLVCCLHPGAKECSLPCLALTAGPHTVYAMVGAHTKSHPFKCEILCLERLNPIGQDAALGQFELAIARDPESRLAARWPRIVSERAFVIQLADLSLGPWQISLLQTVVEQTFTVLVTATTVMDFAKLSELDAQRLERLHALRMLGRARGSRARGGAVKRARRAQTAGQPGGQEPHNATKRASARDRRRWCAGPRLSEEEK